MISDTTITLCSIGLIAALTLGAGLYLLVGWLVSRRYKREGYREGQLRLYNQGYDWGMLDNKRERIGKRAYGLPRGATAAEEQGYREARRRGVTNER